MVVNSGVHAPCEPAAQRRPMACREAAVKVHLPSYATQYTVQVAPLKRLELGRSALSGHARQPWNPC